MAAPVELTMLQLYRHILRAAKDFPSVKKHSIVREIKAEFRANQRLTDEGRVRHCRELAERGLSDLQAYTPAARGGGGGSGESSIHLKGATQ
ncbi:hypothetical protein Rsub_08599 [Raphidocelis subcapitata]|uniref:Complex 1 LYR protein domain-containing protein n=1 Tax=Raphidocelis subcapitata TaxID=307507 RepID=A0A2V0PEL1_9CHLO|nr:hypothetical protein Rsub_08599 [Raphidocelis subcapitata]|eukprot:GBF95617.1 hypothetical protein Rsub_08599 [Raphidocelis subcapitata]